MPCPLVRVELERSMGVSPWMTSAHQVFDNLLVVEYPACYLTLNCRRHISMLYIFIYIRIHWKLHMCACVCFERFMSERMLVEDLVAARQLFDDLPICLFFKNMLLSDAKLPAHVYPIFIHLDWKLHIVVCVQRLMSVSYLVEDLLPPTLHTKCLIICQSWNIHPTIRR